MTTTSWLLVALVLAASVNVFYWMNRLRVLVHNHVRLAVRQRILARSLYAVGFWQISIGLFLVKMDGWVNAVALLMIGPFMILLGRFQRLIR